MGVVDADARRLAKVIDHPIRSRIITLLGDRGPLGWKELSSELGVKTGALYHHLDTLEGLVERDSAKKYSLTKSGKIVYSRTSQSHTIDSVRLAASEIKKEGYSRRLLAAVFVPRSLIGLLVSSRESASLVLLAIAGGLALLSWAGGFSPVLYYIRPDPGFLPTVGGLLASMTGAFSICYASARVGFGSSVDALSLAASSALSFVPVLAASIIATLPSVSSFLATSSAGFTLLLIFFQTWSVTILGAGLSVASGIRIERSLLVSLVALYATMAAMLALGVRP